MFKSAIRIRRLFARAGLATLAAAVSLSVLAPVVPTLAAGDIPTVATGDGRFKTLVAALGAAGLVDTLKGAGPFTVFAPTDAAFAKLPAGTVDALLKDPERLKGVLLYHVVPGKVPAAEVVKLTSAKTVQGSNVAIRVSGSTVFINDAQVTAADVDASNGIVHVIDTVLLPPATSPTPAPAPAPQAQDIAATAIGDGRFKTLVTALGAAGLVDTLKGPGPFTVFAPTDAAFAKLPAGTVDGLLKDPERLKSVLLYHVVAGRVPAAEVVKLTSAKTVQGANVSVSSAGGVVKINDAQVIVADVNASNGIIHAIDAVLLPPVATPAPVAAPPAPAAAAPAPAPAAAPSAMDIASIAVGDGRFTTLVAALGAAGLVDTLKSGGPFTVFAPTDEAFAKLPAGTVEALLRDPERLKSILLYHVVAGNVESGDVVKLTSAPTVQGAPVRITVAGGTVRINNAQVVLADVKASNGVIHVIDTVLLPPTGTAAPAVMPRAGDLLPLSVSLAGVLVAVVVLSTGWALRRRTA